MSNTLKFIFKDGISISLPYINAINIKMPVDEFEMFALDPMVLRYLDPKTIGALDNIVFDLV